MYQALGDGFKFVSTIPIRQERLDLGYQDMSRLYPFCINTYDGADATNLAFTLANDSDVIVIGSAPEKFITDRIINDKLTFRYSERIFKRGRWRIMSPRALMNLYKNHFKYRNKNLYMLCASAYTAGDFAMAGSYLHKTYKWGYFPETKTHDIERLITNKKGVKSSLLWVGRFIGWKHPEKAILAAKYLRDRGYDFSLDMIGTGEIFDSIAHLIAKNDLQDRVKLRGSMKPEDVRHYMEKANIFLATSDFNEGWGAVLNESMNSGCAVVASHAIGSVPFLIHHGKNGTIYDNGSLDSLCRQVESLVNDEDLCSRLGREAYSTIESTWNAKTAATRLLELSNGLLSHRAVSFEDGPLSVAKIWNHTNW